MRAKLLCVVFLTAIFTLSAQMVDSLPALPKTNVDIPWTELRGLIELSMKTVDMPPVSFIIPFAEYAIAWDAQEDANRIKKEKYRAAREARAKCEKFVSRVKKYLSLYLEPDDHRWGVYGFEVRGKGE